ncbi:MAG: SapC family protein [Henriciella sp.]
MANLTILNSDLHKSIRINPDRDLAFAAERHLLPLNISEVSRAIIDFPVLITRVQGSGNYALSALTSFIPRQNAFFAEGQWGAGFQPAEMQTYPFALVPGNDETPGPQLAFDEAAPVFTETDGEPLFDESGQPALWVTQLKNQLLANAENMVITRQFLERISSLGLISEIVIGVQRTEDHVDRIGGLSTINEDRLKSLANEELGALRDAGFLGPIYAILFSMFQLNTLIRIHNARYADAPIQRINLEIARDKHQN